MKALVYEEYAPDDNYAKILKIKEIPDPKPKSNEIILKLKAVALMIFGECEAFQLQFHCLTFRDQM